MDNAADIALTGTPYLVQLSSPNDKRYEKVRKESLAIRDRAIAIQQRISSEAAEIMEPFKDALRSDLVAESNKIEGYDWNEYEVREIVSTNKELMNASIGHFMAALRGDRRVYQALGLYRAHQLAEEWATTARRPREFEIRGLHELVTSGENYAGRYKTTSNSIGGSPHKTVEPWDVPRAMNELVTWWENSDADPALDASVVHAWLTHIHPFADGNGRMARILANLSLAQASFPPFLIRSDADRGQYYDALAASDDGDIMPLYSLMVQILRRTVSTMSSPTYVQDVVQDRLLTSIKNKHSIWRRHFEAFAAELQGQISARGLRPAVQGFPDIQSFALLTKRDSSGNSWFMKVGDPDGRPAWLLWFGYKSDTMIDLYPQAPIYPSVFVSIRDDDPFAVHPYRHIPRSRTNVPDEIVLRPLETRPVTLKWTFEVDDLSRSDAVHRIAAALAEECP